jgi:hypothetical protein
MNILKNGHAALGLDERWPRMAWYESPDGKTRLTGEREGVPPRVYVQRARDRAQLTSDDDAVRVEYACRVSEREALYTARVSCDGRPAAEFEVLIRLVGADATIRVQNVRDFAGYYLLTVRFQRVVAASSCDPDARVVTCGWQGRLLDPAKCKPGMTDYSWHGSVARPCGAAYRAGFMVTFDLTGYEDLFVHEVRSYTRIATSEALASLGGELMIRQRTIEGFAPNLQLMPEGRTNPPVKPLDEPILCARSKEIRLHFIAARRGRALDWPDAARYFQSLVPKRWHPDRRYDDTLVFKCSVSAFRAARMSFEEGGEAIRRIHNLTDGMKQVCYYSMFQHEGGDSGRPDLTRIYPAVGDRQALKRVMSEARKHNAIVSLHDNFDQDDVRSPDYDPACTARDSLGRLMSGGYWQGVQLVQVSIPGCLPQLKQRVRRVLKHYGIRMTYHLDTHSGTVFTYDANPRRPFNATEFVAARKELGAEFEKYGVNVTSECLMEPYLGYIGHVWALFNWDKVWEGEEAVPFANYIYHGVASWNSGGASDEAAILNSLVSGGGAGVAFPFAGKDWNAIVDQLYLIQPVYAALRQRKWSGFRQSGAVRRVEYASTALSTGGPGSFIEVNDEKKTYRVVVDGVLMAQDFATVFPSPRKGAWLAFSRTDRELEWSAPAGWKDGPVKGITLTDGGPGVRVEGRIEKGRLRIALKAHQPVRLAWRGGEP